METLRRGQGELNLNARKTSGRESLGVSGRLPFESDRGSITPSFSYSEGSSQKEYPDGIVVDTEGKSLGVAIGGELFLDEDGKNRLRAELSRDNNSNSFEVKQLDKVLDKGSFKDGITRLSLGADLGKFSFDVTTDRDSTSGNVVYRIGKNTEAYIQDSTVEEPTFGINFSKNFNEGGSVDEQTKNAFTRIGDISAQNVPLIAGPDDTVVGFDELGGTVYRSKTGQEYTLYPETKTKQERPIIAAAKAVGEYISDPSLPSLEETSEFAKEAVKGAYEPFRKIASGDNPTYGDLADVTGSLAGGSAATAGKSILKNDPTQLNIFAGLGAQKADFNVFKEARKLKSQGVSPKNIEAQTGWNEGDDGFWRFEIDDRKARVDRAAISGNKKPSEILDHPELFQNYDLDNNLTISFKKDLGDNWGSFIPASNTIYLNPKLSDKDLKKTLLHEVQHFVQFKESFAGGSNPEWESLYGADPEVSKLRSKLNLLQGSNSSPEERNKVTNDLYKAAYKAYRRNYGEVEANVVGERSNRSFLGKVKDTLLGRELAVDALGREKTRTKFAEGGMVEEDQMNRLMQEGGIADDGMTREPVTGNEIPPGSMASEVRDDIPAQLSEGEYIVPADVVRFFGVRLFEDLRKQAKQGLAEMEANGRIGGTPVNSQGIPAGQGDEELSLEEEQMLMEALGASETGAGMAYGGMVQEQPISNSSPQALSTPYQDQATLYQMPAGMGGPMGMAEGGDTAEFDRTKFTLDGNSVDGGIEARKYINPTTKEVKTVNFLNGMPLGLIPDGFVPWTQEIADTPAPQPPTAPGTPTTEKKDRDGGGRDSQPVTGGTGEGSMGWADKNYDAFTADPFGFGMKALEDANKNNMGVLGKVGALGVFGDVGKVKAISEANLALSKTTDEAQKEILKEGIANLTESISSPLVYGGVKTGLLGSGKNLIKQVEEFTPTKAPTTAPTAPAAGSTTKGSGDKPSTTISGNKLGFSASTPAKDVGVTRTGSDRKDIGFGSNVGKADTKSTSDKGLSMGTSAGGNKSVGGVGGGGGAQQGQAAEKGGSKSFGGQAASTRGGGAFAPGGLVPRKAPTKKPRKGLAS